VPQKVQMVATLAEATKMWLLMASPFSEAVERLGVQSSGHTALASRRPAKPPTHSDCDIKRLRKTHVRVVSLHRAATIPHAGEHSIC